MHQPLSPQVLGFDHYPLSPSQYAMIDIELTIAAHHENIGRRMTIADQLKEAREQIAQARQEAATAVTETADAVSMVKRETAKALKEAHDLRAELAGLTNGGPSLDEPVPTPLPPAPTLPGTEGIGPTIIPPVTP